MLTVNSGESGAEIGLKSAKGCDLQVRGRLFEAFGDKERGAALPNQRRDPSLGEKTCRADTAKLVLAAFHKSRESAPLKDEMRLDFGQRQELDVRGYEFFKLGRH